MSVASNVSQHRFLFLLIALTLLLTSYPAVESGGGMRIVFQLCFQLVLIAGLFSMRHCRPLLAIGVALVVPALALTWGAVAYPQSSFWGSDRFESWGNLALGFYLVLLSGYILTDLFSSSIVTNDRLCGALSVYLLIGVAWGFFYTGLELQTPGSFDFPDGAQALFSGTESPLERSGVLFYFSFITLTTLGYGDITPTESFAQMLTMWEGVLGQAYLTILVARLVGLHVSSAYSKSPERHSAS